MSKVVVKVGSNVLTRDDGTLDVTMVSSLVDQMAHLRKAGYEVILVTSGAVACGRSILGGAGDLDSVEQRQVFSAVGQVRLMDLYSTLFHNYGIQVGQVLTTKDNFAAGKSYDNQKCCMEAMLRAGVLPIVNENDTVCITELMFTDNDELSGLIADMIGAGTLVILSNIDGIYNGDPSREGVSVIRRVRPGEDISRYIGSAKSSAGRGGMQSKAATASLAASRGIRVIIACGKRPGMLVDVLERPESVTFTEFSVC